MNIDYLHVSSNKSQAILSIVNRHLSFVNNIIPCVVPKDDPFSFFTDTNAFFLVTSDCINESCVLHGNILCFSLDINADPFSVRTVIANKAILNSVSMAGAEFIGLFTKEYPHLTIIFDRTSTNHVVRVTMSDTDSIPFVPRQCAIFHEPVGNTPAEENPLAVPIGRASLENRPLGAASRMESEVSVVDGLAILKPDVIANLKAETVAVVVPGRHVFE